MIICPKCNYKNLNNSAKFCNNCGSLLSESTHDKTTETLATETPFSKAEALFAKVENPTATSESKDEEEFFEEPEAEDTLTTAAVESVSSLVSDYFEDADTEKAEAEEITNTAPVASSEEKPTAKLVSMETGEEKAVTVPDETLLFDGTVEAFTDELTGLNNRRAYEKAFKMMEQKTCAIIYMDINDLKTTNDTIGHSYGDELITVSASLIQSIFGLENCFRIGGDEFVVILNGVGPKVIENKIEELNGELKRKSEKSSVGLHFEIAIGYAVGNGILSKEEIRDMAESKMYANKRGLKALRGEEKAVSTKKEETHVEDTFIAKEPSAITTAFAAAKEDAESDSYYDDILPQIEEEIVSIPKDIVVKIVTVFVAICIIAYYSLYQLS